jgi:hypothetical protein
MLPQLPIEIWGSILKHMDRCQRVLYSSYLINLGIIRIHDTLFHTYMLLMSESMKYDTVN